MAARNKATCFVCLKTFEPPDDNNRRSRRPLRTGRGRCHESVDDSDLLQKFAKVLAEYLNLSTDFPSNPKSSAFCSSCSSTISTICDVYKELRAVELRLSIKLGELGEVMMQKPKNLTQSLSKSLADQLKLNNKPSSFVDKLRSLIAFKCAIKGKEVELHGYPDKDEEDKDNHQDEVADDEDSNEKDDCHTKYIKLEVIDDDEVTGSSSRLEDDFVADFDDGLLGDNPEVPRESAQESTSDSEWTDDNSNRKKKKGMKRKQSETGTTPNRASSKKKKLDEEFTPTKCEVCDKSLTNLAFFVDHIYSHEKEGQDKNIQCHFCWMSFTYPQTYSYHLKIRHADTNPVFSCEFNQCNDFTFENVEELNSHLKTHSGDIHLCSTCNWGFHDPKMKELHELNHHRSDRGNFNCPKCSSKLHGFNKFRDHYNLRHGAKLKLHKCSACSTTCLSKKSLQTHMKIHEEGHESSYPYPPQCCELCGQTYKGSKGAERLDRHMKTKHANGGLALACSICDEPFMYERQLDKHMKAKHGQNKHPCSKCDKQLGSTRSLREHLRIVHASEPEQHICQFCGGIYMDFRYLQKHISWMHDDLIEEDGKYSCPNCGRKCRRKVLVQRHLKTCTGKKPETELNSEATGSSLHEPEATTTTSDT